jgi:L-lactate utilization protein LutB
MEKSITNYWHIRLDLIKKALEANNFEVFIADSTTEAKRLVLEDILPKTGAKSLSWGGSMTMRTTGLNEALLEENHLTILNPDEENISREEKRELRRQALLVDLYITGTNAIIETGQLVNLDMIGNRVGAITFGPNHVVILAGRNKIVPDLETAMYRIKKYAAPANAMRLGMKTPCVETASCEECKSPMRICNIWTITEKSFPKGRIKVVLINEDLGL